MILISLGYFMEYEVTIGTKIAKETISYGQNANGIDLRDSPLAFGGISTAIQVQSQIKDTD